MIWAALLIGTTVLLAISTARPKSARLQPRDWLVLPDEPQPAVLALPRAAAVRPMLPALAVVFPSWSAADEGWRTEKPLKPWFRSPAPYAVTVAMGAVSLDLTALGLGVPEIAPTHRPYHDHGPDHAPADAIWFPLEHAATDALFDTAAAKGFGLDLAVWDQSDLIAPSWERPHEASHDWWA